MSPYQVFISHIHEERAQAIGLKKAIEGAFLRAIHVFVSSHEEDVRIGDDWFQEILMNLSDADTVLLLLSKRSVVRPWINFETGVAWVSEKHLIPICVNGLEPSSLPSPFNRKQAIVLTPETSDQIVAEIARRAGMAPPKCDLYAAWLNAEGQGASDTIANATAESGQASAPAEILPIFVNGEQVDALPPAGLEAWAESDQLFSWRLAEAFPGVRGILEITDPGLAIERLSILLREPLCKVIKVAPQEYRTVAPFWWFRGSANMYIDNFRQLSPTHCLLDSQELGLRRAVVLRAPGSPGRELLYLEANPDPPTGLYESSKDRIDGDLAKVRRGETHGYYYMEEYALWEGHAITRAEYDDGVALIDGKPTPVPGAELRIRYLTPYNLLVCGNRNIINESSRDTLITTLLDRILMGEDVLGEIIRLVRDSPLPPRLYSDSW